MLRIFNIIKFTLILLILKRLYYFLLVLTNELNE